VAKHKQRGWEQQIFGRDLISYQDDGKGCAVIADKITGRE
jgi:hypothetical protein